MFDKKGLIAIKTDAIGEDELMEIVLSAGADDMENIGEVYEITCDPTAYDELKKAIVDKEIPIEASELSMVPQNTVPVDKVETARKILALIEDFEDHDDVQNVYANFDIPDEILDQLEG
jgi:transcriptional/translational regulatory protein YebC/TACO1